MGEEQEELEQLLESFHEDVPMTTQTSLTMSKSIRDILASIRDDINATASNPILETNDVIRLALLGATKYEKTFTDTDFPSNSETENLAPLFSALAEQVRDDSNFDVED